MSLGWYGDVLVGEEGVTRVGEGGGGSSNVVGTSELGMMGVLSA